MPLVSDGAKPPLVDPEMRGERGLGLRVGNNIRLGEASLLSTAHHEPHWYAAYTSANHEKRVAAQLSVRQVEYFLPLYVSVRRWKDRRVTLRLPLFPGYVFVRMALRDRLRAMEIPGVARLVGFGGKPAALPEEEIVALRNSLATGVQAEPHPFLAIGRKVRVKCGPMAGLQGILTKRKNRARLVVSVELIQRAIAVEMDEADVEAAMSDAWQEKGLGTTDSG
jgi:transcription antitermination factor NusG